MLHTGQGQVAHDMEAVAPAGGPSRHDTDDDLGHEPDEPLHLEDVEPPGTARIDRLRRLTLGIAVTVGPSDPLVPSRAEGPAAVSGRRPVAGEQHTAHPGTHPSVI